MLIVGKNRCLLCQIETQFIIIGEIAYLCHTRVQHSFCCDLLIIKSIDYMDVEMKTWFLDFSEKGQMWHLDLKRVPENDEWVNIGYGNSIVLDYFCDMVDLMKREFGMTFTKEKILRLAECMPGLTVYCGTPVPEDYYAKETHLGPIYSRKRIEEHIEWKSSED